MMGPLCALGGDGCSSLRQNQRLRRKMTQKSNCISKCFCCWANPLMKQPLRLNWGRFPTGGAARMGASVLCTERPF